MQTLNISLPDPLEQFVDEQVNTGGYSSASEYLRELVQTDQERKNREALDDSLVAALSEGKPEEATPEWWASLRNEAIKRVRSSQHKDS